MAAYVLNINKLSKTFHTFALIYMDIFIMDVCRSQDVFCYGKEDNGRIEKGDILGNNN